MTYDFTHPGVVITQSEGRVLAQPALAAENSLTGGITPAQYVQQVNDQMAQALAQEATQPAGTSGHTMGDYLTADSNHAEIVGQELRGRTTQVSAPTALDVDENGDGVDPFTVSGNQVSIDYNWPLSNNFPGIGQLTMIFAGKPTATNGTVSGNSVTWTITASQSSLYIVATGPLG